MCTYVVAALNKYGIYLNKYLINKVTIFCKKFEIVNFFSILYLVSVIILFFIHIHCTNTMLQIYQASYDAYYIYLINLIFNLKKVFFFLFGNKSMIVKVYVCLSKLYIKFIHSYNIIKRVYLIDEHFLVNIICQFTFPLIRYQSILIHATNTNESRILFLIC